MGYVISGETCVALFAINITDSELEGHIKGCSVCREVVKRVTSLAVSKAGSTRSIAKSEAAKLNGMKGGRPRKVQR